MITPKQINTSDQELGRVQDFTREAFANLQKDNQIMGGVYVTATIGTGDTAVTHGLKESLNGWIIVGRNASATIWESATTNPRPKDQIILQASASVRAKIYFF